MLKEIWKKKNIQDKEVKANEMHQIPCAQQGSDM